jgi:hypothetical protein
MADYPTGENLFAGQRLTCRWRTRMLSISTMTEKAIAM